MSVGTLPLESIPDTSRIQTEDDTPVDNMFSEWQQRLLVETLKASWRGQGDGGPFLVTANVGLFHSVEEPPVVPDVMLSVDVEVNAEQMLHDRRSYFVWVFGKFPDLVIEIVSQTPGGEDTVKLRHYAKLGIPYYAIFDPGHFLGDDELRVYGLNQKRYKQIELGPLEDIGLGLTVWEGPIHGDHSRWLRWTDADGNLIPTADERAEKEQERADQEQQRADQERERAEREKERALKEKALASQERKRADAAEEHAKQLEEKLAAYSAKIENAGLSLNGD